MRLDKRQKRYVLIVIRVWSIYYNIQRDFGCPFAIDNKCNNLRPNFDDPINKEYCMNSESIYRYEDETTYNCPHCDRVLLSMKKEQNSER